MQAQEKASEDAKDFVSKKIKVVTIQRHYHSKV